MSHEALTPATLTQGLNELGLALEKIRSLLDCEPTKKDG